MNYRRRRENYLLLIKEGVFPKDENSFVSRELVGCASLLRNRLLDVTQRSPQRNFLWGERCVTSKRRLRTIGQSHESIRCSLKEYSYGNSCYTFMCSNSESTFSNFEKPTYNTKR